VNPDAPIVVGSRAKYSCRSVDEVDAHLRALIDLINREVPTYHPGKQRAAHVRYRLDIDKLLNARLMLVSWQSIDDDLADLAVGIMRESDLTIHPCA
jgi:hypothetical protein